MHEFTIAASVMEAVEAFAAANHARRIVEVRMTIGELSCVEAEQLKFCFESITEQSALEGATLEIDVEDAAVYCPHCAYQGPPKYWDQAQIVACLPTLECPVCGQTTEATAGRECAIKSVKFLRDEELEGSVA